MRIGLENVIVFSGRHDNDYVQDVCDVLNLDKGVVEIKNFEDSIDPYLRLATNVKGKDVYFVLRHHGNTAENLIDMLFFANAARREDARSVRVIETYMGLSRQDRPCKEGEAIGLQVKAHAIDNAGINSFQTFSIHSDSTALAFHNASFASYPLWTVMLRVFLNSEYSNVKFVAPDPGASKSVQKILNCSAIKDNSLFSKDDIFVNKDRANQLNNTSKSTVLVGNVEGSTVILYDDESVSGKTLCAAARTCKKNGASEVYVLLSHSKFFQNKTGIKKIKKGLSSVIDKFITTNTCYVPDKTHDFLCCSKDKFIVVPTQPIVAEYIRRTAMNESVSDLYGSQSIIIPYKILYNRLSESIARKWNEKESPNFKAYKKLKNLYDRLASPVLGEFKK